MHVRVGSAIAQHEPVARTDGLDRNGWAGSAKTRHRPVSFDHLVGGGEQHGRHGSASAVLRLIARSNLSGRCIGIYSVWHHAGFWNVPRSISWLGNARSLRRSDRRPAHFSGTYGCDPGKRRSGRREYQQLTGDPLRLEQRDRPAHALQGSVPLL
jgi:hypothetical protein